MANTATGGTIANVGTNAWYMTIDGTAAGFCSPSLEMTNALETAAIQFGQDPAPRGRRVVAQTLEINFTLNELTQGNLVKWFSGLATTSGDAIYYGDQKGEDLPTYYVYLYPLHPDGHPLAGTVFYFPKVSFVANGALTFDPTSSDYEGLPITMHVEHDSTQTAGREFFTWDAADDTAPTVSSVTPLDGATNQAIDAAVTVTFAIAMGKDSCENTANVIIMKSDWSAFVIPTSCTLDSTLKVLTIAHPAFANSQEYVVILSRAIRAATGVPIAANYAWDFTTIAP